MSLINTHYYDGKLRERIEVYRKELDEIAKIEGEERRTILEAFYGRLPGRARRGMDTIISTSRKANFDPSNEVNAEDILLLTICKLNRLDTVGQEDLRKILEEQLGDIINGPCVQGRATRVFQAFVAYFESLTVR